MAVPVQGRRGARSGNPGGTGIRSLCLHSHLRRTGRLGCRAACRRTSTGLLIQEPHLGGGDFRDSEESMAPGVAPGRWRSGNLVHLDRIFQVELKTLRMEPAIQYPCGAGFCPSGHTSRYDPTAAVRRAGGAITL